MLIDERNARRIAENETLPGDSLGEATELATGWFFPKVTARIGSNGLIVHKETGRTFHLGSAFPVERDLALYDRGYQFEIYDLVILAVRDRDATLATLARLRLRTTDVTYEHGEVWRVTRDWTRRELLTKLERLPHVFPEVGLYLALEALEEARRERWFDFVALGYVGRDRSADR